MVSIKLPKQVASNEYTVSIAAEIGEAIEFTYMNAAHNFKIIHFEAAYNSKSLLQNIINNIIIFKTC